MMRLILGPVVLTGVTGMWGCSGKEASGDRCSSVSECAAGEVCSNGTCVELCMSDLECDAGYVCDGQVCRPGTRTTPTITKVDGDDASLCADTPGLHCIAAGLLVEGTSLQGAEVTLTPDGGTPAVLDVRPGASATYLEVDLPATTALGRYRLRATNASGSAVQALEFLQGVPGENFTPTANELVNSINNATNEIDSLRLHVGTGATDVAAGDHVHDAVDLVTGTIALARLPSHTHSAVDLDSGTIGAARLPIGTGATDVAAGNHLHRLWTPIAKIGTSLILPFSGGNTSSASLPRVVPSSAREILCYVYLESGNVTSPSSEIEFRFYTNVGGIEYSMYATMQVYSQSAWAYNSDSFWLPIASSARTLYVQRVSGAATSGNYGGEVSIIGYR